MSQTSNLTTKQEKFCRALALSSVNGKTQRDCYIHAYDTRDMKSSTIDEKASIEAAKDKIRARIAELQEEYRDYFNYDAMQHFQDLKRQREIAERNKAVNTSLRATELLGKMTGQYVDKHEIESKVTESISVNIVVGKKY